MYRKITSLSEDVDECRQCVVSTCKKTDTCMLKCVDDIREAGKDNLQQLRKITVFNKEPIIDRQQIKQPEKPSMTKQDTKEPDKRQENHFTDMSDLSGKNDISDKKIQQTSLYMSENVTAKKNIIPTKKLIIDDDENNDLSSQHSNNTAEKLNEELRQVAINDDGSAISGETEGSDSKSQYTEDNDVKSSIVKANVKPVKSGKQSPAKKNTPKMTIDDSEIEPILKLKTMKEYSLAQLKGLAKQYKIQTTIVEEGKRRPLNKDELYEKLKLKSK